MSTISTTSLTNQEAAMIDGNRYVRKRGQIHRP